MPDEPDTAAPTRARRRRRGLWPVLTGVALFAGVAISQAGSQDDASSDATSSTTAQAIGQSSAQEQTTIADREAELDERASELDAQQGDLDALAAHSNSARPTSPPAKLPQRKPKRLSQLPPFPAKGCTSSARTSGPGEYKTPGPSGDNIAGCYYAFMSDTSATAEIVDNTSCKARAE